jgi:hypothetical protein
VLWRVQTASPQSRGKRIKTMVQMLAEGKRPATLATSVEKRKKTSDDPNVRSRDVRGAVAKKQKSSWLHSEHDCQDGGEI